LPRLPSAAAGPEEDEIRMHRLFDGIDWTSLEAKMGEPPFTIAPTGVGQTVAADEDRGFVYYDGAQARSRMQPLETESSHV